MRTSDRPNSSASVTDKVWSPVHRFTEPGPMVVLAAPSASGSTITVTHCVGVGFDPFAEVESMARTCAGPPR